MTNALLNTIMSTKYIFVTQEKTFYDTQNDFIPKHRIIACAPIEKVVGFPYHKYKGGILFEFRTALPGMCICFDVNKNKLLEVVYKQKYVQGLVCDYARGQIYYWLMEKPPKCESTRLSDILKSWEDC